MLTATLVDVFLFLKLVQLPLSNFMSTLLTFLLIIQTLLLLEAFVLKVRIDNDKLKSMFFSVELSDIISIENTLFHTVIRTRWKKYKLPKLDSNILKASYRGGGVEK